MPSLYVGTDGLLRGEFYQNAARPITSAAHVNDGQWHHAVLSAHTNTQTLYLNGTSVGTLTGRLDGKNMAYDELGIGWASGWPGTSGGWFPFQGQIDEPSLYYRSLTADDVLAL